MKASFQFVLITRTDLEAGQNRLAAIENNTSRQDFSEKVCDYRRLYMDGVPK